MSATLAARRRRHVGALAGIGGTRRRRRRRRGISDVAAWFGHKRKHSRAAKKGWRTRRRRKSSLGRLTKAARRKAAKKGWRRRKRKAAEGALAGVGGRRRRRRRSRSRRRRSLGRLTKAARRKAAKKGWRRRKRRAAGALAGLGGRRRRRRSRSRRRRSHLGVTRRRRSRRRRSHLSGTRRRRSHRRRRHLSGTRRRSRGRRRGLRGLGYMTETYAAGRFGLDGLGRILPGEVIERYKMGRTRRRKGRKGSRRSRSRRGVRGVSLRPIVYDMGGARRRRLGAWMPGEVRTTFGRGFGPEEQFMGRVLPGEVIERYKMGRMGRILPGEVIERYKMGMLPGEVRTTFGRGFGPEEQFMGRVVGRGRGRVTYTRRRPVRGGVTRVTRRLPWFARGAMAGMYANPKETFGVGPFKYIFSTHGLVGIGGLAMGRTVSNIVSHLLHFFLTSKDAEGKPKALVAAPLINHVGDLIGAVGGYELGQVIGRKAYGTDLARMATLGAIGGQLFSYLAKGTMAVLDLIGLEVPGGAKYGGLGRYGAEGEERAIGRYGAEGEERAIGRYGAEGEERAIGRYGGESEERAIGRLGLPGQGSRPGGSRALPAEEQEEKGIIDEEGPEEVAASEIIRDPEAEEPEEEFLGALADEPEEEFLGSGDNF